jgi:hypothetical protein
MAMEQNPGFLAALGMNLDRGTLLEEQRKRQYAEQLALTNQVEYETPYERQAAQAGAILGANLFGDKNLPPEQEAMLRAQDEAGRRMEEWLAKNKDVPVDQREEAHLGFVAEEAYRNGLHEIGTRASTALEERRKIRLIQGYELEAAGLKPAGARLDNESKQALIDDRTGVAGFRTLYKHGETDPNKGRYLYIDRASGNALDRPGGQVVLKAGEYSDQTPDRPDAFGRYRSGGGSGGGSGFKATPTEFKDVREAHAGLFRRSTNLEEMRDVLEESIDTTGTLSATGNAGKVTAYVSRWANDLNNILQASGFAGEFTAIDENGDEYSIDSSAGRQQLAKQYRSTISSFLPPEFRKSAGQAARWSSLVTEMLYLEARAMEPGSKQFSDADIQHMAKLVASNVNNPETLSKIILSSYNRAFDDLDSRMLMYPEGVRTSIVTPEYRQMLQQKREQVTARWGQPLVETNRVKLEPGDPRGKAPRKGPQKTDQQIIDEALGLPARK